MYLVVEHPEKGTHALDFELLDEEDSDTWFTAVLQFAVKFEGFIIKEWDDYSDPNEDIDQNRSRWRYNPDAAEWELWLLPNESMRETLLNEAVKTLICKESK